MQSLGAVIGPTALITALLFYFGYTKVDAFSSQFGLHVSLFGLSTQDYLLQSIRSVFVPLGEVLIGGLVLLWAHQVVSRHLGSRPDRPVWRWLTRVLGAAGVALFALGLVWNADVYKSDRLRVLTPISLLAGVCLFSYAVLLDRRRRRCLVAARSEGPGPTGGRAPGTASGLPALSVILVSVLVAVGLVWVVAEYADLKGRDEAAHVLDQLHYNPGVVVYSPKSLNIGASGVTETRLDEPDSTYGFRYDGLKLLFHSNGRYFLVPETWSTDGGRTVVLPDDDESLRVEFVHVEGA